MALESISFNTFFVVNKYRLKHDFILMLNPEDMAFYRDKEIYYAIQFRKDHIFIVTAVGHGLKESIINLLSEMKKSWGYSVLRFGCQKNSIMHKYAKTHNAIMIEEILNAYNSGENGYVYEYRMGQ